MTLSPRHPITSPSRRGMVLMIAIVCVAVASLILLVIVRTAVAERDAMRTRGWEQQARWLATSGVNRAAARLAADPAYPGETWRIAAGELGLSGDAGAVVRIEVTPEGGKARLVRAVADCPDDPQHRARRTKQVSVNVEELEIER